MMQLEIKDAQGVKTVHNLDPGQYSIGHREAVL